MVPGKGREGFNSDGGSMVGAGLEGQKGLFLCCNSLCSLERAARGSSRGGYNFKKHLDSYMGKMGIEGYGPSAGNWD